MAQFGLWLLGKTLGAFIVRQLITVGLLELLNVGIKSLTKSQKAPPLGGISITYSGTLEPRRIVYGQLKVAGMHCIPPLTSGDHNDYFHQVIALAGHAVDQITDVYLGQVRIPNANIGGITHTGDVTKPGADGAVSGIPDPPEGQINGAQYNGKVWIRKYEGRQTVVDTILHDAFPTVWDANHIGADIAYLAITCKYDQAVFSGGAPEATAMMYGKRVYDPRSTSMDPNDSSTWAYSTNVALCLRDFLTSPLGLGDDQTKVDDTLCAAAASTCDEWVAVPLPVVEGLTSWTSGDTVVTGDNTNFLALLVANGWVRAPSGTMYQIDTVDSDTQLTLKLAYVGSTISDQVTQYNNSTNSTAATQRRYTCNTALDATARFEENIAALAKAMMGHCIFSGGKWRMFAGDWPGTSFNLEETDLAGTINVQCTTPRQDLYNAVRGSFIDPQQNYQPSEFASVWDANYIAEDGGETIYLETNFSCCNDRYEAQRNAIILLRQSRNRRIVTAQFGMSAFRVRTWDVGTITLNSIGWVDQTVRCIGWRFSPQGNVELTLQEAYAADWTDPLVSDYSVIGVNVAPLPPRYLPYPPTMLTATPVSGGIEFTVVLPDQVIPGTTIELWEGSLPIISSAQFVMKANATKMMLARSDQVTRYYWVRTAGPNGQFSAYYPTGTGVAAAALAASFAPWGCLGFAVFENGDAYKKGGSNGTWDSSAYSLHTYDTCHVVGKITATDVNIMIGLSETPSASASYTNIDYAWFPDTANNRWQIYEPAGTMAQNVTGTPQTSDVVAVTWDGAGTIKYLLNGVVKRTTTGQAIRPLGAQIAFNNVNDAANHLAFGPTTNLSVNDTAEIGDEAVSQIISVFDDAGISETGIAVGSTVSHMPAGDILTIAATGAPIAIDCSFCAYYYAGNGCTGFDVAFEVYRDDATTGNCPVMTMNAQNAYGLAAPGYAKGQEVFTFQFVDDPPPGSHTYTLYWTVTTTGTQPGPNYNALHVFPFVLKIREIKK